jgi:capsular polysaccharide export protein
MTDRLPVRRFLFLQGPSSPFFARVARELRRSGAETLRVGTCPGDRLFWLPGAGDYIAFRKPPEDWPETARAIMKHRAITDLVCLGDGRPFHRDAIGVARGLGVRISIVEQGYLRPGLLTIEPNGMGGNSGIPAAFEADRPSQFPVAEPRSFKSSFLLYAAYDVAFHFANLVGAPFAYPHYRNHALHGTLDEWRGWIGKALKRPARRKARDEALAEIEHHDGRIFLFPLQLETDYQIRQHGYRDGLRTALAYVVSSFAAHAPKDALLVVKVHPIDNGLAPWAAIIEDLKRQHGCERVIFLDGGDLERLMQRSTGIVTVNSTVGLSALSLGRPVKVLGSAIYNLKGLTDDQALERFWQAPQAPSPARVSNFLTFLKTTVLVPGAFEGEGAIPGARAVADRLLAPPPF